MVEEVEELEANPKGSLLPTGYFRILRDVEICIEISWASKVIASLRKLD